METKKKVLLAVGILILLGVVLYFTAQAITKYTGYSINEANLDDFAKCLSEKGVKMYGSRTCPHCADQKALFGDSFKYINYIECLDNPEECYELTGVPAWNINGKIIYGTQKLEKLAELSGCKLS